MNVQNVLASKFDNIKQRYGKFKRLIQYTKYIANMENRRIVVNGKKMWERDLPNCVSSPYDEFVGCKGYQVKLYPEDEEKIKRMSVEESIAYTRKLLEEKRYID